ncbi:helix-turn-helix domain-containing protein [Kribbella sp. NPDC026611]|uniref:TetR/AcrR family transcriptional regulator n=1 Tax=Kribbella sp. NPDC026611 TaxID=3154911 RepID=UPI0033C2EC7F
MAGVKRSTTQERAAATRARIVRAAYDLFCAGGYRATTMEAIGKQAGVAVQTVYFTFRTKDELLKAVHEWTVLGDTPMPPALQPWHVAAMKESDARAALAKIVAGVAALNARIAPMLAVFNSVSQQPVGEIYARSKELRRHDMGELVVALRKKTPLRAGLAQRKAADLLDFLMGPESYGALVIEAGWTERQWVTWTADTLNAQLFG